MNSSPYRTAAPGPTGPNELIAPADPIHAAQAQVLQEVASGLRILNERVAKDSMSAYDYQMAVDALKMLHDSIMRRVRT